MKPRRPSLFSALLLSVFLFLTIHPAAAQQSPLELQPQISVPFRFVAFGDTRFTDPANTEAASAPIREALVRAIAKEHPAFVTISGDIVLKGPQTADWEVYDSETKRWRDENLTVYPALGNHDVNGDEHVALKNYFQRFPDLKQNRFYSVRMANCLMLVLDSNLELMAGQQIEWVQHKLDTLPADADFVIFVLHHPPYTSSTKESGGHAARSQEQMFGAMLEAKQAKTRARFVVFGGHVHNYERQQHGGVTYFVTGGGGAHPYPIQWTASDLFHGPAINYHYLLAEVDRDKMHITMHRVEISADGKEHWSEPDQVTIKVPRRLP